MRWRHCAGARGNGYTKNGGKEVTSRLPFRMISTLLGKVQEISGMKENNQRWDHVSALLSKVVFNRPIKSTPDFNAAIAVPLSYK